jgi:hypothetical protein
MACSFGFERAKTGGGNSLIYAIVLLAFAWNLLLLIGVVLNLDFARTRAAGGQFINFPTAVRVLYIFQCALIMYQVRIFMLVFRKRKISFEWLPRVFVVIGILGVLVNAVSRSSDERWNVIPGAIITWAFWHYGVKREKSDF